MDNLLGGILAVILSMFFGDIFIRFFAYIFRKTGLFTRYVFYLLIGRKKTFKHLDRRQRDPVEFTQRGINIFIGMVIFFIIIGLMVKYRV